jgi:hypothetical protein
MQRRTVLGALWVALGGRMSGCTIQKPSSTPVSDDTDVSPTPDLTPPETSDQPSTPAPDEFDQCETLIIRIENLPDPAQEEAAVALEEGRYESDDELYLPHVMPLSESYLAEGEADDEEYYVATVDRGGATTTLEVEPTIPSWGAESLIVANDTDDRVTVEIRVDRRRDSEVVVEETLSIPPDADVQTTPFDRVFGTYGAEIRTDRFSDRFEWEETEMQYPMGEFVITSTGVTSLPRPVLEPLDCWELWERAYEGS